jgi:hypothetical protein
MKFIKKQKDDGKARKGHEGQISMTQLLVQKKKNRWTWPGKLGGEKGEEKGEGKGEGRKEKGEGRREKGEVKGEKGGGRVKEGAPRFRSKSPRQKGHKMHSTKRKKDLLKKCGNTGAAKLSW